MHFKRLAILFISLVFVISPIVDNYYSYAAINDDILWQPLNSENELVEAFQYYCKSRDLTIEGSVADAVTTATTGTFNGLCNKLGIDITALQADIKKSTDEMGNIQFLFDSNGITAYNRIFSQFLQDNELEVGDAVNNKVLYSGYLFVDANGISCLAYVINTPNLSNFEKSNIISYGTYYCYSLDYIRSHSDNNNAFRFDAYPNNLNEYVSYVFYNNTLPNGTEWVKNNQGNTGPSYEIFYKTYNSNTGDVISIQSGEPCVFYNQYDNNFYVGSCIIYEYGGTTATFKKRSTRALTNVPAESTTVFITTNNTVINNNNYEGDTIINNYGEPSSPNQPAGGTPPNWDIGGGQGTVDDGNGNTWNINFPDFQLPDLNIDWSINGLGNKFPFSIPFDLVSLITVLNAEPQAPRFQGTINFGFTSWNYDINLQPFDTVASVCRIAELLLLVFGLILVTRSIIKG